MKGRVILLLSLLISSTAHAAPPPVDSNERPWAKGVPEAEQKKALELFNDATKMLKDSFFKKAVDRYLEALGHWDHPAIHFNVAKALMALDDPVPAYEHLSSSMKYGGPPLDAEEQDQVKTYKKLLYETELAELNVVCEEPDAVVTMNGTTLFKGPGQWKGVVRPNNVTILATKEGFQVSQSKPNLKKGMVNDIALTLLPLDQSVRYVRPFGNWIPWTVVTAGALILGGGAIASWQSGENLKAYDDAVATCNTTTAVDVKDETVNGNVLGQRFACTPDSSITSKKDTANTMKTLSTVGYIAGGAVLATGIVLLYVNRERPITVEGTVDVPVTLVPYIGPDGGGVSATIGF